MQRTAEQSLTKIASNSTTTITRHTLRTVDFRPLMRQEGQRMTAGDDDDTAMSVAMKRAALDKFRKREAKRKEREERKQARLDALKVKKPDPADLPPMPAPAPQTGAALQVSAQHFVQDNAAREQRIQKLAAIATGKASVPERVPAERLPPSPPSGPDDPRIRNGTLAPSPKVAAMLKTTVSETAAEAGDAKPLQSSAFPPGWLEILEHGTPEAILAGRHLKDLKGDERAAYDRAFARQLHAILRGRSVKDLTDEDRTAYWQARARHQQRFCNLHAPRRRRKTAARTPVGARIDDLRHSAGLTRRDIANCLGADISRFDRMIRGKSPIGPDDIKRLAELFNMSPEKLMSASTPDASAASPGPATSLNGVTRPKTPKRPGYNEDHDLKRLLALTEPREGDSHFQAALRRIMRSRGLMAQHVAKLCGISLDVPGRLLRKGDVPAPATRERLIKGLGVTEEELFGVAVAGTPSAPAMPEPQPETPAPEPVVEKPAAVLVGPSVPIEMDIPMPPIVLRADSYPWAMPKGGSFKAELPFGMPWATFRSRFLSMLDRQSEKLGHWYTYEENEAQGMIRVWRYI